jgi:hypothetical protein
MYVDTLKWSEFRIQIGFNFHQLSLKSFDKEQLDT